MYKFDQDYGILTIDNKEFLLDDSYFDEQGILFEAEYQEILNLNFTLTDYLDNLTIESTSTDGFGTNLFYDIEICKDKGKLYIDFICRQPNKYWEGKYGLSTFLVAISEIISDTPNISTEYIEIENDWKELILRFNIDRGFVLNKLVKTCTDQLNQIIKQAELVLSGVIWRQEFETNESLFCTEIVFPLIRKMGFIDVRYTHGVKEYGKDFTFSEQTKFGNLRHFGLQAKAGNISGKVNAPIDEIIGQLDDAFSMPYVDVSATEKRHISTFIVAISGYFADNAKDKIIEKIPNHFKGCVYFIDKDKAMELIEKYWK